jgi:hypothetical protein
MTEYSALSPADLLTLQYARAEYLPEPVTLDFAAVLRLVENHLDFGREAEARELLNLADSELATLEAEDDGRRANIEARLEQAWQRLNGDYSELED